jgi:hypothetical protein
MAQRRAGDEQVASWRDDGWVLLDGLIDTATIDAAIAELPAIFPTADEFHGDPAGVRAAWLGARPTRPRGGYEWPASGPGFRDDQHIWSHDFPFAGAALNRLVVHPAVVDFCERALESSDLRVYQAHLGAKYAGQTNYEQPMHTDRNHSWLPTVDDGRVDQVQLFCYLSDVDERNAPTHLVSRRDAHGWSTDMPLYFPQPDAGAYSGTELYERERAAPGVRGSVLAYRNDVFHRGVDLTGAGAARFHLATAFRRASAEWVGYTGWQHRATAPEWTAFVEGSTPSELEMFGFPPPGHPVWTDAVLDATALRYPHLDLGPWRTSAER